MDRKAIGRKILATLKSKNRSLQDLETAVGVSSETMRRWISGERQITVYGLKRCAEYLGVTMDYLTEGV